MVARLERKSERDVNVTLESCFDRRDPQSSLAFLIAFVMHFHCAKVRDKMFVD